MAESKKELKSLLVKVKEKSEETGLKLSIQRTKIMGSGPITSWQIEGEKVEALTHVLFLGSKITVDGDCSHEIKRLAPWKESYDEPRQCIKKQRHHFANKGPYSQVIVFPVVMYGFERWIMKKVEHQRMDAFKLWCWRRLLRVVWTARRSIQSILKESNP